MKNHKALIENQPDNLRLRIPSLNRILHQSIEILRSLEKFVPVFLLIGKSATTATKSTTSSQSSASQNQANEVCMCGLSQGWIPMLVNSYPLSPIDSSSRAVMREGCHSVKKVLCKNGLKKNSFNVLYFVASATFTPMETLAQRNQLFRSPSNIIFEENYLQQ